GDFVDRRLGSLDINPNSVRWDARRRADGEWIVRAGWTHGDDEHAAEWIFHRSTRSVTAADAVGAEVLSDRPLTAPPQPTGRLGLLTSVAPPAEVVAFPPMPDADTGPVPVIEEVFDQAAFEDEPAVSHERLPDPALPVPAMSALADGSDDFGTPPLPLSLSEPNRVRRPERRREPSRQARTKVPSWDDILLGVRPKGE
ncbi:MAG: septation protein SepH, partial [Jatrophihabitans sp.]|uniref:septation protein SepH n=1 Tax=Jatrophihabitans sp. TaxID=1932789 RepID=UPI003F7E848C